jgi:hypothetical protein
MVAGETTKLPSKMSQAPPASVHQSVSRSALAEIL